MASRAARGSWPWTASSRSQTATASLAGGPASSCAVSRRASSGSLGRSGGMRRAILAALALAVLLPAAAGAQVPYDPDTPPPGANDWTCKPTAAHPNPVVLVHGLSANAEANWYWMAPKIAAQGYCVYALTYGRETSNPPPFNYNGGLKPMEDSVLELSAFVDRVLAATGAQQVDIVGHSERSLMPDYYLRFVPGAHYADGSLKVQRYVGMTPLWDGTDPGGLVTLSDSDPTGLSKSF